MVTFCQVFNLLGKLFFFDKIYENGTEDISQHFFATIRQTHNIKVP